MSERKFHVLIIGAGPAGAATAIALGHSGLSVGVLEKARFPRDKICGDALSVDVVNQLSILSPTLSAAFEKVAKTTSYGVSIYSPDRNHIDIPFFYEGKKRGGYICPRLSFDHVLIQQFKEFPNVELLENCQVNQVTLKDETIEVQTSQGSFQAPIIIGADGAHSVVSKNLVNTSIDKHHYSAGLRMYYENVSSFHDENFIELHFFKEILPGYLWIFPLPGNKANVGLGMLSSEVSRKRINLKETLQTLLSTHPDLKKRFQHAKALESVKGFGLPLGSKRRILSGERFLLAGDAASLIDPFTGEGIANAIRSGRIAAAHIIKCFENNDFSKKFNSSYDKEIYRRMWKELRVSKTLQHLCKYSWLFNFVVKKANQSKGIHQFLIDSLANIDKKKSLAHPSFYLGLFFNKEK